MSTTHSSSLGEVKPCPFHLASEEAQALVMKAARKREAFVWKQIKDQVQSKSKMTRAELKATRKAFLGTFERAAVMIFDRRAEGADTWDTWLRFLRLAQEDTQSMVA